MLDGFQLDAIYIAFITISVVSGYLKASPIKISNPAALFYSIFVAIFFTPHAIPVVNRYLQHLHMAKYVSIFILYLITIVVFMLMISAGNNDEKKHTKHKFYKIYGVFFGCVRGFFISFCCCIFILIFEINKSIPNIKQPLLSSALFKIAESWMPGKNREIIIEEETTDKSFQKPDNRLSEAIKENKKQETPVSKQEKAQEQNEKQKLSIIKYIADFFSRALSGLAEIENKSQQTQEQIRPSSTKINDFIKAKYGCLSLLEARIKRRAQLKKKRIEKEILRRLDDKNKLNDEIATKMH